jgi:hypothetical protein
MCTRFQQLPHALDRRVQAQVCAHVHDVADFLVQHIGGEAECRDVGAHQAAGYGVLLEYRDFVAQGQQVVGDGERCRAGADTGDALAVFLARRLRQQRRDVVAIVGGDAFQTTDGNRLFLDSAAPAGGFAGSIADSAQDTRKNVGLSIHHVRGGELALGDQSDVFGNIGVRRTGPLAIDHPMEIIRFRSIGRLHDSSY